MADLIERVCHARGGAKAVTDYLDLSYSQVRKMAGDGSIPNLAQILRFTELAGESDPFRGALVEHLGGMFQRTPEQIADAVIERVKSGTPVGDAVINELSAFHQINGRWIR